METKPKRQVFQPYIPVHRRNQPEKVIAPSPPPTSVRASSKEETEVKRRGRGQFRAPLNEENEIASNANKCPGTDPKFSGTDVITRIKRLNDP